MRHLSDRIRRHGSGNKPLAEWEFLLGGIDNSPSKNSEQIEITPSIDNPSKKRRNWGESNGTIYWRTITRGGKDYLQAYYHWQEGARRPSTFPSKYLGLFKKQSSRSAQLEKF